MHIQSAIITRHGPQDYSNQGSCRHAFSDLHLKTPPYLLTRHVARRESRDHHNGRALATLNALRTGVTGLVALTDAGSADARINQLFRERAIWLFGRGYRLGDMRRLIRQYNRTAAQVFPVGTWHKGGNYGSDVNFPVPQAEQNNPNLPSGQSCLDRNA